VSAGGGHCARVLLVSILVAACGSDRRATSAPVRVAAASDLTVAFEELGRAFTAQHGTRLTFSFGATGLLARQIRGGAPFDVFAAADVAFIDELVAAGACDGATRAATGRGRLVVWTRRGGVPPPATLEELADPRFVRLAIANPAHAPYGRAAREVLERAGVWPRVQGRLVLGENVRQALQLAESGNVEAALVAHALVVHDRDHPWMLVDERLHRPLEQALVVCGRGDQRQGGAAFARFVTSEAGRAVMERHGFPPPEERPPSLP
jgi:molybdate transport system substrate-binding protein